ncbi:MAG: DUF1648 domain-containing protein [Bryobacteraceae bacterium]
MRARRVLPIILPWFALAGWFLWLSSRWPELPQRMAVHFSMSGEPNGWSTKGGFAAAMIVFWISFTVLFSALALARAGPLRQILPAYYFTTVVFLVSGIETILANLGSSRRFVGPYIVLIGVPVLIAPEIVRKMSGRRAERVV